MTEDSRKTVAQLARIIQERRTLKVLGNPDQPVVYSQEVRDANDLKTKDAIANAGWAPFHYARNVDGIAEPWRVHFLCTNSCRHVASQFHNWVDDLKPSNKLPAMLCACGAVVLVTWLPQFREEVDDLEESLPEEKRRRIDDEHLSATAAMVQNLLLLLTAEGFGTYWSSGGQLGSKEIFEQLGIDRRERLVAAVFVEYPDGSGPVVDRVVGKNRARRSDVSKWLSEK